jgi:hypothetical protein
MIRISERNSVNKIIILVIYVLNLLPKYIRNFKTNLILLLPQVKSSIDDGRLL